ncbi:lactoylglutathione lyase [Thioalkalivibrio sulfidiphilus HL-EbGr7]|uniref:lactoylglutathione lyase n=1 Tax=Thioalkalivibrio sulfidiphilus (strain HL-EbGR7) TaxID=396588 RepID=B8GST5_THISH|nr:lactoylglutathione lyase [Thioalkalivibrio sulfidiphilus HL-EbGr7]
MSFKTEHQPGMTETPAPQTRGFRLNHSMLRVKDPERSLAFYSRVFGMRLLRKLDFPELDFSLYFLAALDEGETVPEDVGERTRWTFSQRGILELTHNYGTEIDPDFHYHDGNAEPQGFGHICFAVPDLDAAVKWLDDNQVRFVKRPEDGALKDVAFVTDPDGYWIEILEPARLGRLGQT